MFEGGKAAREATSPRRFTRAALVELRRWPSCRSYLASAAGHSGGMVVPCTSQRPSCCLQKRWGAITAPGAVDEACCCEQHSPYLEGANATLRSAHTCSAVPGLTLSFARLLLQLYSKHRKGGAEPPGLMLLLEAEARPHNLDALSAFLSAHPPTTWDVVRLHGGGSARPAGTTALLLHTSNIVKVLDAFSTIMAVSSHGQMLSAAAKQRKLRVLVSEQRIFYPVYPAGWPWAVRPEKQCGGEGDVWGNGWGGVQGESEGGGEGTSEGKGEGKGRFWARLRARAKEARARESCESGAILLARPTRAPSYPPKPKEPPTLL